jgi:hypothetical protein
VQSVPTQAQALSDAPVARAAKVIEGPVLDGRVADDPVWMSIEPLVDFWQTAPDAGEPSSERTDGSRADPAAAST